MKERKKKEFQRIMRYWSNKKIAEEDYLYRQSKRDGNDEEAAWRLALDSELKRRNLSL